MHLAGDVSAEFEIVASSSGADADIVSSRSVNLPSGSEDDAALVLCVRMLRDDREAVAPTGWDLVHASASVEGAISVFARSVSGALSSVTLENTGGDGRAAWVAYRITGAALSEASWVEADSAYNVHDAPDPPELTPSWGSAENIWLAVGSTRRANNTLTIPSGYANQVEAVTLDADSDTLHGRIASGDRLLTAASEDPAAFGTSGQTNRTFGVTIAVRAA